MNVSLIKSIGQHPVASANNCCAHILVFKTSIRYKKDIKLISPVLDEHHAILKWNIDQADIDNVLRIESTTNNSSTIIEIINKTGFFCEELPG